VANVFFSPFAEKLGLMSRNELVTMEIAIRGVLAIQSGESPRAIDQKLQTYLPAKQRELE
ncbi:MAG: motility protein A, partial [Planctomycetota bacterium]